MNELVDSTRGVKSGVERAASKGAGYCPRLSIVWKGDFRRCKRHLFYMSGADWRRHDLYSLHHSFHASVQMNIFLSGPLIG